MVSIIAARSPGSAGTGSPRPPGRRGDAGGLDRVASRDESRQRPQLVLALEHVARGHRHVAVEGGIVAGSLGDVEGDLIAAGDQRAEAGRGLGGQALDRLVQEEIAHAPGFRPCPALLRLHERLADQALDARLDGGRARARRRRQASACRSGACLRSAAPAPRPSRSARTRPGAAPRGRCGARRCPPLRAPAGAARASGG